MRVEILRQLVSMLGREPKLCPELVPSLADVLTGSTDAQPQASQARSLIVQTRELPQQPSVGAPLALVERNPSQTPYRKTRRLTIALAIFSLTATTHAQVDPDAQIGFTKACEKMRKLAGVEFASVETQTNSISMEGHAARDLVLGGATPRISTGMGGAVLLRRLGAGSPPAPGITLDLAFYVDPETNLIHRIKAKAYQANPLGANVQFRVAGGALNAGSGAGQEAEDGQKFDDVGNPKYKKGLRIRQVDGSQSVLEFSVLLSEHGKSFTLELDKDTQALLRRR